MPTTTVKSIGTSSRDYSTVDAWVDACPANIVSSDEIWKGECYKDSEFVAPTNSYIATASGITTDNTRYLWLTTATGQSFVDDGSAATLPLRYDTTKGVSMKANTTYSGVFHFGSIKVLVEKIMVYYDVGGSYSSSYMCQGGVYRQMIFESRKTSRWTSGGSRFYNCLLDDSGSGAAPVGIINDVFTACTVGRASDAASGGTGMNQDFGYYPDLKSTAVFGFATNFGGTIGSYNNCNNVASNSASVPGTSTQASLTYADQFENTTAASRDWRVKFGSALIANGSREQGTEGNYSTLGTNDIDIIGRTRSTTTPTIGCWEVVGGTNLTIQDALHAHTADALTLTQQHVLVVADASHAHLADNLTLTQTHVLAIADALHAHAADNVVLSVEGTLTVADALHAHTADNLTLTQAHVLAIADALHAHLADNLTLVAGGTTLEIADALHAHLADGVALTQLHILTVSDALHAHLADTLTLSVPGAAVLHNRVLLVRGENRTLVILPENRTLVILPENRTLTVH